MYDSLPDVTNCDSQCLTADTPSDDDADNDDDADDGVYDLCYHPTQPKKTVIHVVALRPDGRITTRQTHTPRRKLSRNKTHTHTHILERAHTGSFIRPSRIARHPPPVQISVLCAATHNINQQHKSQVQSCTRKRSQTPHKDSFSNRCGGGKYSTLYAGGGMSPRGATANASYTPKLRLNSGAPTRCNASFRITLYYCQCGSLSLSHAQSLQNRAH